MEERAEPLPEQKLGRGQPMVAFWVARRMMASAPQVLPLKAKHGQEDPLPGGGGSAFQARLPAPPTGLWGRPKHLTLLGLSVFL